MKLKTSTMKALTGSKKVSMQDLPLDIRLSLTNPQTLAMNPISAVRMLLHYFPKQTKNLLERAMSKAHAERRIILDKKYHASFKE